MATPGPDNLLLAADVIYRYFNKSEITFAFAGNLARTLYGDDHSNSRQKIEAFLFTAVTSIHELKQALANAYPASFTYNSNPRSLHYHNSKNGPDTVEIALVDATFGAPEHINFIDGLPVIPYSFLILRELMFWDNTPPLHKKSRKNRSSTILRMLPTLRQDTSIVHVPEFDEAMHAASIERVARFFEEHPSFRKEWQRLGLIPHRERTTPSQAERQGNETPEEEELPLMMERMILTIVPTPSTLQPATQPSSSPTPELHLKPKSSTPSQASKKPKISHMQIRRLAARTTVAILRQHGLPCVLFGSMACKLYGNPRIPNDIDVLVLPPPRLTIDGSLPTQESIKSLLVETAPSSFFLKPSRDPEADYKVLYFLPTPSSKPTPQQSTKVDILLPGVMNLPLLPLSRIELRMNNIIYEGLGDAQAGEAQTQAKAPALPFSLLLLHKLQAWDDHRHAEEAHHRAKVPQDMKDLEWMLDIGVSRYLRIDSNIGRFSRDQTRYRHPGGGAAEISRDMTLCGDEFVQRSAERVEEFCEMYPEWRGVWTGLGFGVTTSGRR